MDPIASKYWIYVATVRGVLQCTNCKPDEKPKYEITDETSEVTALEWGRTDNEILLGYKKGHFAVYDSAFNKYVKSFKSEDIDGSGSVVGLGSIDKSVIIGQQDGIVNVWNENQNDHFDINLNDNATLDSLTVSKYRHGIVGTGGESNDLKLWNVETYQCIFKAKSLGHDILNLPIPTSVRGITFFPEDVHLTSCVTKEGHVLLYDDRAQRRPVVKFHEKQASYTTIASAYRQRQCFVGTTKGYLQLLDMKAGKCLKTFKSFTGSVTSIACDPVDPYVATTSLDRYLRVHNTDTKELVYKSYMKQSLTKLIMKPVVKEEPDDKSDIKTEIDEEYEELFDNMEKISDNVQKRKSASKDSKKAVKKKKKTQ